MMSFYHASWSRKLMRQWSFYINNLSLFLHHLNPIFALSIKITMPSSKDQNTFTQDHSNNMENLSSDFAQKVRLPYKSAPTIVYSDRMKSKLLDHNKLSIFIRVLDGKIVAGNLRAGLEKLWAPFRIVKMELYRNEVFQVWLENQHQLELILKRQPWIVSQHILQIEPWIDVKENKELDFNKFFIWVQLLNFPEIFQDKEIVENNLLESGCFGPTQLMHLELYPKHKEMAELTRVKVLLDVNDPIPPGFKLPESINGAEWIQFAYEYLPIFCFRCGFIGHIQASCNYNNADFCAEPQFTSTGLKFELYNAKNRIFPKPIAERPLHESPVISPTEPPRGHYPFLTRNSFNVEGLYTSMKGPNDDDYNPGPSGKGKGKGPMIMELNTPDSNLGTGQHFNEDWMINDNPVNSEVIFSDQLVFNHQLPAIQFNPLQQQTFYAGSSQTEPSNPNVVPLVDLTTQLDGENAKQMNQCKRQEISQGRAADTDGNFTHVQTEVVDSFNMDREQRRKTPLHVIMEDRENSMSSNSNTLCLSSRRKRSQTVKAAARKQLHPKQ